MTDRSMRGGVAAIGATVFLAALFTGPLAFAHSAHAATAPTYRGAVSVTLTLPAGMTGGCRTAQQLWPDGVIGSPITIRRAGHDVARANVAGMTSHASGCTWRAPTSVALRGTYRVAVAGLPWRTLRTDAHGILRDALRVTVA